MKEVGNKIQALRLQNQKPCANCPGKSCRLCGGTRKVPLTIDDAAQLCRLSRETMRKIEDGQAVKLKTVRRIASGLGATKGDLLELTCTWLRAHAGPDANEISITPIGKPSQLRATGQPTVQKITNAVRSLSSREQHAILLAIQRPAIIKSIMEFNSLFEAAAGLQPARQRRK